MTDPYRPRRPSNTCMLTLRGLPHQVRTWGDAGLAGPGRPPLVMVHGWMDVGASYQFVVDALAQAEGFERWVIAPDWRGFGGSARPGAGSYWFPDYLADLEALLDALAPFEPFGPVDLVGHSMGGNIAMSYAGVRAPRIRRLVNLEGFGLPETGPEQAPERLAQWLDELKQPKSLRPYPSVDEVAARLLKNDPLLTPDKAAWLAPHWAAPEADGLWHLRADPAHKRVNPVLYRVAEVLQAWKRIAAPVLWVEGDRTDLARWWGHRYPRAEFEARLAVVPQLERAALSPSGHMLHHDQPQALARHLARFLA
ncbi:MAG: alpha/beta hydrolase [Burkholderiales bacterium]|nr:alpha/beta hydrolase [Burkholderiales bacterium]